MLHDSVLYKFTIDIDKDIYFSCAEAHGLDSLSCQVKPSGICLDFFKMSTGVYCNVCCTTHDILINQKVQH